MTDITVEIRRVARAFAEVAAAPFSPRAAEYPVTVTLRHLAVANAVAYVVMDFLAVVVKVDLPAANEIVFSEQQGTPAVDRCRTHMHRRQSSRHWAVAFRADR